jgi:hypothetical protein
MVVLQMPGDRVRPSVQACPGQFLAQPDDQLPTTSGVARGEFLGRRDRGSNAVSPSARYRATSRDTHPCETP